MKLRRLILVAVVAVIGAACGTAAADGPPDIKYGRDICVQCNMIISEIGHAAAYRLDSGIEKKFDSVGEMLVHGHLHDEFDEAEAWVHDLWTEEWVRAERAFYVPTLSVASPMGHGVFSFGDRASADQFAADVDGEVLEWEMLLLLPVVDGRIGGAHDHEMTEHAP